MHSGDRRPLFVYGINIQNPDFFFLETFLSQVLDMVFC